METQRTRSDNAKKSEEEAVKAKASAGTKALGAAASAESRGARVREAGTQTVQTYATRKTEFLNRSIIAFTQLFRELSEITGGPSFLLLDELYHLRLDDQADVVDFFHRIAKNSNLWLKVGTIRHRSRWYKAGPPPIGMKIGDDATLDKYDLTKRFLMSILKRLADDHNLDLDDFLTDGARDRMVLASGGVARDMLAIFLRAVEVARERIARGDFARGEKIGAEDINGGVGQFDSTKRQGLQRDTQASEENVLLAAFQEVTDFCLGTTKANIVLVEKDYNKADRQNIDGLVDLKFLHLVKSRVTVRDRANRIYDAYMLDMSQYVGERARRNFNIVEFWGRDQDDELRKARFIYREIER